MPNLASAMQEKSRGIVLRSVRYGEASVIASVFTETRGMLGFIVKTSHTRRATARNLLLSPLAIVDIDYDYRERKTLLRPSDVRLFRPYRSLPYQPSKLSLSLFLCEFLSHALRHEQPSPSLFRFLTGSLSFLDDCPSSCANFHFAFLLLLTRHLGFWPSHGEVAPMLSEGEQAVLPLFLRMNYRTMHLFRLSRPQRERLLSVATDYYRLHVPSFPQLKSAAVLRDLV